MLRNYLSLPRAVHVLCTGALINRAGSFLLPFLTIYLQRERGFNMAFATLALGLYGVGATCASAIGGHLADRIGRRIVMILSLGIGAFLLILFGYLTSAWLIALVLLLFSFCAEMYRPASMAMIVDVTTPEQRPHAFGLMYVAINLGFTIAGSLGGAIAERSFLWLFWGDALTTLAFTLVIVFLIRETLEKSQLAKGDSGIENSTPEDRSRNSNKSHFFAGLRRVLADPPFMVYWIGSLFLFLTFMQAFSTLPLYMDTRGIGTARYGRIISLNGAMIVLFQLPVTMWVTRFHRGRAVSLAAVVTACGFGLTQHAEAPWQFAGTVAIWTLGEMMHAPLMQSIISDLAPADMRARYMGVYATCFSISMMLGAPLGGLVLSRGGGAALWYGACALGLVAACAYALVSHAAPVRRPDP